jgi:hypothetical protein
MAKIRQFNTEVACAERTTRDARDKALHAFDSIPEWGDIGFQTAIEHLQQAARMLENSRINGWVHANEIESVNDGSPAGASEVTA